MSSDKVLSPFIEPKGYRPPVGAADLMERYTEGHRYLTRSCLERRRAPRLNAPGANLSQSNWASAVIFESNLSGADFSLSKLQNVDLRRSKCVKTWFSLADLTQADLREADLSNAHFTGAKLSKARLRGASLMGASLEGADLQGADLELCDLRGVDLSRARLGGVRLLGARYDLATRWPINFEPLLHGAVQCDRMPEARQQPRNPDPHPDHTPMPEPPPPSSSR